MEVLHQFEVPLYVELGQDFREAIKKFSHSTRSAIAKYYGGQLTFTFVTADGEEHECYVAPISDSFPKSRVAKVNRQISAFTSKFNCAMALKSNSDSLTVEVIDVSHDNNLKSMYGRSVRSVVRVAIVVTNLPVEMALNSFFAVVDLSK